MLSLHSNNVTKDSSSFYWKTRKPQNWKRKENPEKSSSFQTLRCPLCAAHRCGCVRWPPAQPYAWGSSCRPVCQLPLAWDMVGAPLGWRLEVTPHHCFVGCIFIARNHRSYSMRTPGVLGDEGQSARPRRWCTQRCICSENCVAGAPAAGHVASWRPRHGQRVLGRGLQHGQRPRPERGGRGTHRPAPQTDRYAGGGCMKRESCCVAEVLIRLTYAQWFKHSGAHAKGMAKKV